MSRLTIKPGRQRRVLPFKRGDLTPRGRELLRQASQRNTEPRPTAHGHKVILSR
jgi:hypothetical protein